MLAFLLAVALSFIPGALFAYVLYSLDRFEKEPPRLVLACFAWGALVAAAGAFIGNTLFGITVYAFTGDEQLAHALGVTLSAPVLEELVKGLAVLLVFLRFRHEFDTVLDAIVYAGITALGFAAAENVIYLYFTAYLEHGMGAMLATFAARVVLAGWLHPIFTSCFGIGLALARLSPSPVVRVVAPLAGLLLAMALHATHNALVTFFAAGGYLLALAIHWLEWLAMAALILWALLRQRRWMRTYLPEEVRLGTLSERECTIACSLRSNFRARRRGPHARRLLRALARLAITRHHIARAVATPDAPAHLDQLRAEIIALRATGKV